MNTMEPVIQKYIGQLNLILILFLFISCGTHKIIDSQTQKTPTFQVGFSQKVITPTDTAFIAGHSHNRKFKGVNDDIYVKAAVISSKENLLGMLTFDCIGLMHPQLLEIRSLVKQKLPSFPVENIMMTSTHTHSGPDVVGLWGMSVFQSGVDQKYMDRLIQLSAESIIEAYHNRQACIAEYAQGLYGEAWVHNISEPEEIDRSLTILRFHNEEDNVLTLTNFACHPTFLDAVNDKVSSDYVGGYYKAMDEMRGGGNMFFQGAIGGWVQPEYETKTHDQAFFRGDELATEVIRLLENSTALKGSTLDFKSSIFQLPMENQGFRMLAEAGVVDRAFSDSVTTEVAYFEIGNASFATHPGETVPELSHRTKASMENDGPKFVVGLGMDALGYILKPYFFDQERAIPHSSYLCKVSVGPQTQELIFAELKEIMQK